MKHYPLFLAALLALPPSSDKRTSLLCHQWKQIGHKSFGGKYQPVTNLSITVTFDQNGHYTQVDYGKLRIEGRWTFSRDSSKIGHTVTVFNGRQLPALPVGKPIPTLDTLLKLTPDTLVYGKLATFGPGYGPATGYGHDDWYFVRVR